MSYPGLPIEPLVQFNGILALEFARFTDADQEQIARNGWADVGEVGQDQGFAAIRFEWVHSDAIIPVAFGGVASLVPEGDRLQLRHSVACRRGRRDA